MRHFSSSEFYCCPECGLGMKDMRQLSLAKIDHARYVSGVPFKLNSTIRCGKHNAEVGGKEFSAHLTGAFDIKCTNTKNRFKILKGLIAAGFNRIGIYKTFIHADDDETKPAEVVWMI